MRFVHTADWQLGMTRYFLNGEAQPRYSAARRDVVAGIGPLAPRRGRRIRRRRRRRLRSTTNLRRATSASRWRPCAPSAFRCTCCPATTIRSMRRRCTPARCSPPNARTTSRFSTGPACTRCGPACRSSPRHGRSKAPTTDLVAEVLDGLPADGVTRIVVGHGGVDIFVPDKDRPSLIRLAGARGRDRPRRCALCGVGRQALSHCRSARRAGSGTPARRRSPTTTTSSPIPVTCWSSTSTRTIRGRPVRVDARRVGRWRFVTLRRSVDSSRDVADLDINLDLMPDKERTVVRLGAHRIADRDRQGRARCVPGQVRAAVRGARAVGQADRHRGDPRRR